MKKKYFAKTHFLNLLNSIKVPNAQKYLNKDVLRNQRKLRTLCVGYNTKETHFVMSDFIRQSKKLRSNVIEKVEMDISLYSIKAIILDEKASLLFPLERTFLIRNVFSSVPYEAHIPLQSPIIDFASRDYINPRLYRRNYLRYLREKPLPQSKIVFTYITGVIIASTSQSESQVQNDLSAKEPFF